MFKRKIGVRSRRLEPKVSLAPHVGREGVSSRESERKVGQLERWIDESSAECWTSTAGHNVVKVGQEMNPIIQTP